MRFRLLVALMCVMNVALAQMTLFDGLVGCYKLDGNAFDESDSQNHGVVLGAVPAANRFGQANKAYFFDGINDYVSLSPAFLKSPSYSYVVWAKVASNPVFGQASNVISVGDVNDSKHQTINVGNVYASDGLVGWNVGGYNDGIPTTTSLQSYQMPTVGAWYHLAITRDNQTMKMYLNGVLIAEGSTNGNNPYYGTNTTAHIGRRCNYTQPFHGAIDDLGLYNRVLSGEEVRTIYENGLPCDGIYVPDVERCGPGGVTISASGAEEYLWLDEAGEEIFLGNPFVVEISESQTFFLRGTRNGITLPDIPVHAVVNDLPEFELIFPDVIRTDEKVTFTSIMDNGQTPDFIWQIDGETKETHSSVLEHFFFTSGAVELLVSAHYPNGCIYSQRATLLVSEKYPESNLFEGLLGCYSLDGDAKDNSGNANHGTVSGASPAPDRFNREKRAYYFDGKDSYISLPPTTLKNNSYTFSVWAKVTSNPATGSAGIVFSIGDEFDSKHQTINVGNIYASDGLVGWNVGGYNIGHPTTTSLQSYAMPKVGEWYHIAGTRTDDLMKMYINGVLIAVGYTNGNPPYYGNATNAHLGLRCNYQQPFHGVIDEFLIYGRDLSAKEIQEIYTYGLPCQQLEFAYESPCGPDQITVSASGADEYYWYNENGGLVFEGNPLSISLDETTTFTVQGVRGPIQFPKSVVEVVVYSAPEIACNFPDLELFGTSILEAEVSGNGPMTYVWSVNSKEYRTDNSPVLEITPMNFTETNVHVKVTDANGCTAECSSTLDTHSGFFIPNVISVNGDGKNEMFNLFRKIDDSFFTYEGSVPFALEIYNRWGESIYLTKEPAKGWTGSEQADGVYFYNIRIGDLTFKGWVQLIKS